jgi:alpha-glucosidase
MVNKKYIFSTIAFLLCTTLLPAQKSQNYDLKSPDGNIAIQIGAGAKLQWSVLHKGQQVILPSSLALQLQEGVVLGDNAKITSAPRQAVAEQINAINLL